MGKRRQVNLPNTMVELTGKTFRAVINSTNGTINSETTMTFVSEDGALVGVYSGGTVASGSVIARRTGEQTIEMLYQCLTVTGELRAGHALGRFEADDRQQLRMHLDWQWLTGDQSTGQSEWVWER
ncbi:MAG: hypothetical protein ACKVZH_06350 [Blastocatellia bacterium]